MTKEVKKQEATEVQVVVLPDYLKSLTGESDKAASMVSVGGSIPRISIKGRQFRFIEEGEEVEKTADPINIIILGVEPENGMAKTFYLDGYQPGSTDPPDCSSWNGVRPDSWCNSPQSDTCMKCPQNVWGSAKSMAGKKAKACKDSKRLIVVKAEDIEGTIYVFNVTVASLKALSVYGKFLMQNKVPMAAAVTQIEFIDSEFPQVQFNFAGILKKAAGMTSMGRAETKEWKQDIASLPVPDTTAQLEDKGAVKSTPVPAVNASADSVDEALKNW